MSDHMDIQRIYQSRRFQKALVWALVFFVLLMVWSTLSPFAVVPAGSRGVMTTFGKPSEDTFTEGIHFRVPLIQTMYLMDVRILKNEGEGDAASMDLQQVRAKVAVNFHLDPMLAAKAFKDIGQSTEEIAVNILEPARTEAVKSVTAQFTAEQLITKRTEVRDKVAALLREKLNRHGIVLDEFAIINFSFSPSFTTAIEAKVNAEQERLKAERDLMRIRVEAEQKVASARAEAESLRLQRQEVTSDVLALRTIEKWDGHLPQVTGGTTPMLDISKLTHLKN